MILKPANRYRFLLCLLLVHVVFSVFFARAHARVCLCECVCFVVLSPTHFIHSCCTVVLLNFQWNSTMCCKHVKWTQVRVKDRCRRINRLVHTLLGILERTKDNRPKKKLLRIATKRIALMMLMMSTTMMMIIINKLARSTTSAGISN